MSKNKLIFAAIIAVVLLIVGTGVIFEWFGPPRTIVLEFPGPAGANLVGEIDVDGVIKTIDQKLPAKFEFQARRLAFALVATENKVHQHLQIQIQVDRQFFLGGSATGVYGEVYAPILFHRLRGTAFFQQNDSGKIR